MTQAERPVIANVDRLHEFMDRQRLAAIAVRSGQNFTYLSGIAYPGTLSRYFEFPDSGRSVLLVWPRHGEAIAILNSTAEPLTLRDSWIKRVEVYEAYVDSLYGRLCQVLKDLGVDRDRVGLEKSYVSALHWEEIQRLLPHLQMVDCTQMMDAVRWIKTPGEIAVLKAAADILDDAYLEVFPTIRDGETERRIHSRIIASCISRGANWAHGMLHTSRNPLMYGGESDETFRTGDVVRTDYVSYFAGYPGHQSRNAVLGKPTADQQREYNTVLDIYRRTIDRCRPGVRSGEIYDSVIGEFKKRGWQMGHGYGSVAGHSVGPWWHQQEPIIRRGANIPLEEGMVLAIEPPARNSWHLQDMIIVRDGPPELISAKFSIDQVFVI